jgi:hypothetical protein
MPTLKGSDMNGTAVAVVVAGAMVAGAVLYSSGALGPDTPPHRQAVMDQLIDPESAQFRSERQDDVLKAYCGEVNSRNSLGGYVGWQHYIYYETTGRVLITHQRPSAAPC